MHAFITATVSATHTVCRRYPGTPVCKLACLHVHSTTCNSHSQPRQTAEEQEATEAQQEAFALLKAAPHRTAAAEILSKVLKNIVDHPTEAKYRCVVSTDCSCADTVLMLWPNGILHLECCCSDCQPAGVPEYACMYSPAQHQA